MKSKIFFIFLLISVSYLSAQQDVKILSSDFNSATIEYSPLYVDTSFVETDNGKFRKVEILNGEVENLNDWGSPAIPVRKFSFGVPSEFGNTIEVLSSSYKEISGQIIPVPYVEPDSQFSSYIFKKNSNYSAINTNNELVSFGEFGLLRDVNTQIVKAAPVIFDPSLNKIRIYTKIVFRVNFGNTTSISSKPADDLLNGALINFNVAKYWTIDKSNLKKTAVTKSVLASGKWVRFEAPEEGMYKISRSALISLGIDPNTVDPRTIKIYNNGGKVVPENILTPRPNDLVENAIIVVGEEDGKFDDNDYIIFYGRGSSFWDYDSDGVTIKRFFHPYSKKNYFWITSGGVNGKRMTDKPGLNTTPAVIQTSTKAFASWEEDKINLGKTGRQFVGDDFSQSVSSRTYMNKLDGRISSVPINYNFVFVIGSSSGMALNITENGSQVFSQNFNGYGSALYTVGTYNSGAFTFIGDLPDNRSVLNFKVTPSSVTSVGYLDYLTIQYEKELKAFGDNLLFFSNPTTGIIEYDLNGFTNSNIKVYDITDYQNVKLVTNYSLLSGSECRFQFDELANKRSKYFAVGNDAFKTPINPIEIQNSNLHGEQTGAKFLIITHKNFKDAANNLKTYKENQAPITISTYVADVDEIYNEFSSGVTDPTAVRDYIKYAFDNWQIKPEYVLLFGKGTYDYKNIEGYGDNFVPTWQSEESLALVDSYTTDDFFVRVSGTDFIPDLALGRITCRTAEEANNIVNKIKDYELNQQKGNWRNLITLIADDGRTSTTYEGSEHTAPSENLANTYFPNSFDINKIYSAAYPDVLTGQGRRKPLVNQAIINAMNDGTLFVNYIGHGSPELWAHEVIFEKSVTIPQLKNDKYFFLCAATCDFGYFDIPNFQSAAEAIMFLPNAGAIASFTAARLVYSGYNHQLNYAFVQALFQSPRDTLNLSIPIGKASFLTKKTKFDVNDRKYNIFGDPTLRLLVPQYAALVDSINGKNLAVNVQIQALSKTKIDGRVLKPDNTTWDDFNGEGVLTFFDSQRTMLLEQIGNYPVTVQGGIIFNGRVSINNGRFSTEFVVPKDISYENKKGKIIFYFLNNSVDGLGYSDKVIVGGTDSTIVNDGKGPAIEIFFDDVAYSNSYLVNPNPNLIVKLYDETGLNTTGTGVGHKLEGILNQKVTDPIDFTNHFKGDLDAGGKSGTIDYKFNNLGSGDYQLLVKAWDVFNNFSEENTFFSVVEGNDLTIRNVYNYPNPFSGKTQFTFQQNLSKPVDVKIKVYTIAGRLIKEIEQLNLNEKFVVIDWDGRDADGDQLASGTYLYKIIVKSSDGEFQKSVLGKLAVIN
ncbi:MAG TPA: type IX secretion system sortase PorU [Ignavibacteriaceae bacterium]|nr:type IX secretion system sortase PorU [Ignavibacteriaceae bacterium]